MAFVGAKLTDLDPLAQHYIESNGSSVLTLRSFSGQRSLVSKGHTWKKYTLTVSSKLANLIQNPNIFKNNSPNRKFLRLLLFVVIKLKIIYSFLMIIIACRLISRFCQNCF